MSRKRRVNTSIGSWPQIIQITEEKLRKHRLLAAQLEETVAMFRTLQEAGEPSPGDLMASKTGHKQQKQA